MKKSYKKSNILPSINPFGFFFNYVGSERVKETKTAGESLTEANNINKSLLTLGK